MKKHIKIDLGKDFNKVLGHRYRDKGEFSGQEFYEDKLLPSYLKAKEENKELIIDLTNVISLPPSFLSESFGKLSTVYSSSEVNRIIKFVALNKERFIDKVLRVIQNPTNFTLG